MTDSIIQSFNRAKEQVKERVLPDQNTILNENPDDNLNLGDDNQGLENKEPDQLKRDNSVADMLQENREPLSPDDYNDLFAEDSDLREWGKALFFDHKLPKGIAKGIVDSFNQKVTDFQETESRALETFKNDSIATLRKTYGNRFEETMSKAAAAGRQTGGQEFIDLMKFVGLDHHPVVIKHLVNVSKKLNIDPGAYVEDNPLETGNEEVSSAGDLTKAKLEKMMADKRYSGNSYQRDAAYIRRIENGWKELADAGKL